MAWPQFPVLSPDTYPAISLPRPSTLQRNLLLDLSSAVGLGTTMAVVGVLLPSVARREGLESMGLAALAALPFLASLLTLFAGRIGPLRVAQHDLIPLWHLRAGIALAFGLVGLVGQAGSGMSVSLSDGRKQGGLAGLGQSQESRLHVRILNGG